MRFSNVFRKLLLLSLAFGLGGLVFQACEIVPGVDAVHWPPTPNKHVVINPPNCKDDEDRWTAFQKALGDKAMDWEGVFRSQNAQGVRRCRPFKKGASSPTPCPVLNAIHVAQRVTFKDETDLASFLKLLNL